MIEIIVFVGLRGSGKTTCARELSKFLNWQFVDTDHLIISKYPSMKIGEIYQMLGERKFRLIEGEIIEELKKIETNTVVSTGGGACLSAKNRQVFRSLGRIFSVDIGKDELLKRWNKLLPYSPKMLSFDDWSATRKESFEKLNPEWIDPTENGWMEQILVGVYGK